MKLVYAANKARRSDGYSIAASRPFRSRACWLALAGPEHILGGFGVAKTTERKPCGNWPAGITTPALDIGGLRLDITLKEFTNIVGASVHVEGNKAYAFFEDRRTMTEEETSRLPKAVQAMVKTGEQKNYFDVVVSVVATFSEGRLVKLEVWKTETT